MEDQTKNYCEDINQDDYTTDSNIAYVMELENKVNTLADENSKLKNDYLYLRADMDNMKKRYAKQIEDMKQNACIDTIKKLIPCILDLRHAYKCDEGNYLIYKKFTDAFAQIGIDMIEPTSGDMFNIDTMNAISAVPTQNDSEDGTVYECAEPGFKLGNTVIKYADVIVYSLSK